MKAMFFQRLFAYVIDIVLVSFIVGILMSLLFPSVKTENANDELMTLAERLISNQITTEVYINRAVDLTHKTATKRIGLDIITFTIYVLYFVVYQFYNGGQTLGKRIMRIRIIKKDGNKIKTTSLSTNDLAKRSLIINGLLMSIITLTSFFLGSKTFYFYVFVMAEMLQILIVIISAFMILYREDGCGLHDVFAGTKVVIDKEVNIR